MRKAEELISLERLQTSAAGVEHWADLLLGPPLQIIGILLLAFVLRRVSHRLINRVARGLGSGTAGLAAVVDRTGLDPHQAQLAAQRLRQRSETIASTLRAISRLPGEGMPGVMIVDSSATIGALRALAATTSLE